MADTLIAYFSRAGENYFGGELRHVDVGNTEIVADILSGIVDADVFKIEMRSPYSEDYNTCIDEAKKDLRSGRRPEILPFEGDIGPYGTVILGYPNYWGTMPMAVFTFLEENDLSGKRVLPFCTNEGSGMGRSEKDLKDICPEADVCRGLPLNGGTVKGCRPELEKWLKANGVALRIRLHRGGLRQIPQAEAQEAQQGLQGRMGLPVVRRARADLRLRDLLQRLL